jgi:uncharacterized ion transporter superfamily protein YfcC
MFELLLSYFVLRQKDIGLEVYATKQLLLHLITPTAVVIITVIQLHYCHTKFLEWSEIPPRFVVTVFLLSWNYKFLIFL